MSFMGGTVNRGDGSDTLTRGPRASTPTTHFINLEVFGRAARPPRGPGEAARRAAPPPDSG
jgi:hypothetical protein